MRMRLHNSVIEKASRESAITGQRIGLTDADQRGLMLRITPGGIRTWVLSCRDFQARYRMFTIGAYPAIGLAAARLAARAMREDVRKGADPTQEKRARSVQIAGAQKQSKDPEHTIRSLMNEYENLKINGQKSWPNTRRRLTTILTPIIDTSFSKLAYADLRDTFENHSSQISAKWGCAQLKPVFRWAIESQRDYVPANFINLNFGKKSVARKRVLSPSEIKAVLLAINEHMDDSYLAAMRFMLLTLLRVNEVAGLQWHHVDLEAKTITLPETKNGETHVLPLSGQAMEMIEVRDRGQESVFSGIKSNWFPAQKRINRYSNTSGWHRHDLRRTGSTLLGELGVMPDIIEAALNHVSIHSPLAATYNRSRYRPQVAEALQRLADHLDGLIG